MLYISYIVFTLKIGSRMKENIQEYIASSAYMQNLMIPFYSTREGVLLFEKTERILREKLPQYISEVEGLANGSELPYKTIMMLNINCPSGSKGTSKPLDISIIISAVLIFSCLQVFLIKGALLLSYQIVILLGKVKFWGIQRMVLLRLIRKCFLWRLIFLKQKQHKAFIKRIKKLKFYLFHNFS